MKQVIKTTVLLLSIFFLFGISYRNVFADACTGGDHCLGSTTVDRGSGCSKKYLNGTPYCATEYQNVGVNCDGQCTYSNVDSKCASSSPPCQTVSVRNSGTCCSGGNGGGGGGGDCSIGPITGVSYQVASKNPTSGKFSIKFNWTGQGNTGTWKLYAGSDRTLVYNDRGCNLDGDKCVVSKVFGSSIITSYTSTNVFLPDKVYFYQIQYSQSNRAGLICRYVYKNSLLGSCSQSPALVNLNAGENAIISSLVAASSTVESVSFRTDSSAVSLSPVSPDTTAPDRTYPYQTRVTAVGSGTASVYSDVNFVGSGTVCKSDISLGSTGSQITATGTVDPWWQVKDADVTAVTNISSNVPSTKLFSDNGVGGYPGIPVYGGGFNYSPGGISSTNWNANTQNVLDKLYNYQYFESLVPDDITFEDAATTSLESGGTLQNGYYWYKFDGTTGATAGQDMTIPADINIGNRKVILFVKGANLDIKGKINVTDGVGFFGVFVNGQIMIDPAVTGSPALEGLYVSDDNFTTGESDLPLHIRGSIASYGGITLQRDLADDSNPAELLEYAPDQIMMFPSILANKKTKWLEIAP